MNRRPYSTDLLWCVDAVAPHNHVQFDEALVAAHYNAKVSDSEEVLFEGKMC